MNDMETESEVPPSGHKGKIGSASDVPPGGRMQNIFPILETAPEVPPGGRMQNIFPILETAPEVPPGGEFLRERKCLTQAS